MSGQTYPKEAEKFKYLWRHYNLSNPKLNDFLSLQNFEVSLKKENYFNVSDAF